jgi:hypothetical protein
VGTIVGVVGVATIAYGALRYFTKGTKVSKILEDGAVKGYIGATINPLNKQYALTFAIAF